MVGFTVKLGSFEWKIFINLLKDKLELDKTFDEKIYTSCYSIQDM